MCAYNSKKFSWKKIDNFFRFSKISKRSSCIYFYFLEVFYFRKRFAREKHKNGRNRPISFVPKSCTRGVIFEHRVAFFVGFSGFFSDFRRFFPFFSLPVGRSRVKAASLQWRELSGVTKVGPFPPIQLIFLSLWLSP